jgi:hypothetical protein
MNDMDPVLIEKNSSSKLSLLTFENAGDVASLMKDVCSNDNAIYYHRRHEDQYARMEVDILGVFGMNLRKVIAAGCFSIYDLKIYCADKENNVHIQRSMRLSDGDTRLKTHYFVVTEDNQNIGIYFKYEDEVGPMDDRIIIPGHDIFLRK